MHIADLARMGFLPLQDHDPARRTHLARTLYGVRLEGFDEDGFYKPQKGTAGDVVSAVYATANDEREKLGAWAFAMPMMALEPSSTKPGSVETVTKQRTKNVFGPGKSSFKPIREVDDKRELPVLDTRFDPLKATVMGGGKLPKDHPVLVVSALKEDQQQPLAFPAPGPLIAVNKAGEPSVASLVADLKDDSSVDQDRRARLHSQMRVVLPLPGRFTPSPEGGSLALQLGPAGRDGVSGHGLVSDKPFGGRASGLSPEPPVDEQRRTEEQTSQYGAVTDISNYQSPTPVSGQMGGAVDLSTRTRPPQQAPSSTPPTTTPPSEPRQPVDPSVLVVASLTTHLSGPIDVGEASCPHRLGMTKDGEAINSAHIAASALYRRDAERDATLDFANEVYVPTVSAPITTPVHLRYDFGSTHEHVTGTKPGRWRWQGESWIATGGDWWDPRRRPPPPEPKKEAYRIARGSDDIPLSGPVTGPKTPPPATPLVGVIPGHADQDPLTGVDKAKALIELAGKLAHPNAMLIGDGTLNLADNRVTRDIRLGYDPEGLPPVNVNPYPRKRFGTAGGPLLAQEIAFQAQPWQALARDYNRVPAGQRPQDIIDKRPHVAVLAPVGAGTGYEGGWTYKTPPVKDGTQLRARGGLALLPPGNTVMDLLAEDIDCNSQPAYLFIPPECSGIALAYPTATGIHGGYEITGGVDFSMSMRRRGSSGSLAGGMDLSAGGSMTLKDSSAATFAKIDSTGQFQGKEISGTPSTPPSGFGGFYTNSSGDPYHIDDAGTTTLLGGGVSAFGGSGALGDVTISSNTDLTTVSPRHYADLTVDSTYSLAPYGWSEGSATASQRNMRLLILVSGNLTVNGALHVDGRGWAYDEGITRGAAGGAGGNNSNGSAGSTGSAGTGFTTEYAGGTFFTGGAGGGGGSGASITTRTSGAGGTGGAGTNRGAAVDQGGSTTGGAGGGGVSSSSPGNIGSVGGSVTALGDQFRNCLISSIRPGPIAAAWHTGAIGASGGGGGGAGTTVAGGPAAGGAGGTTPGASGSQTGTGGAGAGGSSAAAWGGAGGGGGGGCTGNGGGGLWVEVAGTVTVGASGRVSARGGDGGAGGAGGTGGGGGGAGALGGGGGGGGAGGPGGLLCLRHAGTLTNSGAIDAAGGTGGTGGTGGGGTRSGGDGGNGSAGEAGVYLTVQEAV